MTGAELVLTFLGTGSAIPPNDRQQVSAVLRHQKGLFMFDCGEGTQYALRKLGISIRKEIVIWISHLHSDHFLGLPGLLSSFQLLGRDEPVIIAGPEGIYQTVEKLIEANYINYKYKLGIVELAPGTSFESDNYVIHAVSAKHDARALSIIWKEKDFPGKVYMEKLRERGIKPGPQIGKLQKGEPIEIDGETIEPRDVIGPKRKGRVIVYSGDTAYNPAIVPSIQNADVLIHEGTYPSDMKKLAEEREHCTVTEAAEIAKLSQPKRLVITHLSPRIQDLEDELSKVQKIFHSSEFAYQGLEIEIPYPYHD